ncbi:hypothetical protein FRB99_003474, partial [Tulasnella sp. 403]
RGANGEMCRSAEEGSTIRIQLYNQEDRSKPPMWVQAQYLSHGSWGCVYNVVGDFPDASDGVVAVIKTPRLDKGDLSFDKKELEALGDLKKLIFNGVDSSGRQWVIMKKADGSVFWEHPEVKARYPLGYNKIDESLSPQDVQISVAACDAFVMHFQDAAIAAFREPLVTHGWDNLDPNWENIIFSHDYPFEAELTDWGDATKIGGNKSQRKAYWNRIESTWRQEVLVDMSPVPLRDNAGAQGFCYSVRREEEGEPWQHPQEVIDNYRQTMGAS